MPKIFSKETYQTNVLIEETEIKKRVTELGNEITNDYQDKDLVLIGALTGSFIFMADLCREIELDLEIAFIKISSYGNKMESSGEVKLEEGLKTDVTDKDVIVVEDIIDSGLSLAFILQYLKDSKARSVKVVTLLNKPKANKLAITADYVGFNIENDFVIGYGLDFASFKRNLKSIYKVKL
jgi:hypoxanthine phosphoribosyltransferase